MAKKGLIAPRYRLKVKQRLAIVRWAMEHGIKPACARFGLDRKTIREWLRLNAGYVADGIGRRPSLVRPDASENLATVARGQAAPAPPVSLGAGYRLGIQAQPAPPWRSQGRVAHLMAFPRRGRARGASIRAHGRTEKTRARAIIRTAWLAGTSSLGHDAARKRYCTVRTMWRDLSSLQNAGFTLL